MSKWNAREQPKATRHRITCNMSKQPKTKLVHCNVKSKLKKPKEVRKNFPKGPLITRLGAVL